MAGEDGEGSVEAASLLWMLKQKDRERQCQVSGGEKKWRHDSDEILELGRCPFVAPKRPVTDSQLPSHCRHS